MLETSTHFLGNFDAGKRIIFGDSMQGAYTHQIGDFDAGDFKRHFLATSTRGTCRIALLLLVTPTLKTEHLCHVRVAVISAINHKRQRRKRQSVTAEREKSQTP